MKKVHEMHENSDEISPPAPSFWLRSRAILNDKGNKTRAAKKKQL